MRKFKQFVLLLTTISLVTFSSCSSSDDGGDGGTAGKGTLTAKIEGTTFTSLETTSFASVVSASGQSTLIIQGNTSTQAISMTVNGYNGVGTYQISSNSIFIVASYIELNISNPLNSQTWSAPFQNSGIIGEIKISKETDTNITGTFNFTCKNSSNGSTKSVTEGSFNLKNMTT